MITVDYDDDGDVVLKITNDEPLSVALRGGDHRSLAPRYETLLPSQIPPLIESLARSLAPEEVKDAIERLAGILVASAKQFAPTASSTGP